MDNNIRMRNADTFRRTHWNTTKSQTELTLEYIEQYGSITPLEALQAFGSLRLGARIWELRNDGYAIKTDYSDGDKYFAIYSFEINS